MDAEEELDCESVSRNSNLPFSLSAEPTLLPRVELRMLIVLLSVLSALQPKYLRMRGFHRFAYASIAGTVGGSFTLSTYYSQGCHISFPLASLLRCSEHIVCQVQRGACCQRGHQPRIHLRVLPDLPRVGLSPLHYLFPDSMAQPRPSQVRVNC